MRLYFQDPAEIAPPTTDLASVLLYESATESGSYTLVSTIPYVALQGYIDYGSPVEGRWYAIKFKDAANNLSPALSRALKFTTVAETMCLVFDTVIGMDSKPVSGAKVRIVLNVPNAKYNGKSVTNNDVTLTTDAEGNWDMPLIPNTLIVPAGSKYIFYIGTKTFERTVPNEATKRFADMK